MIEKAGDNYPAYVPDLPGRIAKAQQPKTLNTKSATRFAFHIEGLREDGLAIAASEGIAEYVDT